ncbi:hypothetical protein PVAG01_09715 [Phlyctema vagabunda]|uniref:Uncharacterized protein n=1 Tax=Phlyctema vagabunda TaxID=108571 RepID=A0ABR4P853_9HELO
MPFTEGTVAEYDILVQVTEKSLNDQLRILYWTPADTGSQSMPDIPDEGDTVPSTSAPNYLIRHDLVINDIIDGEASEDEGIFGHIECPVLSFVDRSTVRLTFKFGRISSDGTVSSDSVAPLAEGQSPSPQDSFLRSQKIVRKKIVDLFVDLNGFSMSFDANLDRKDFTEITNDIINRSNSEDSSVKVPEKIIDKLDENTLSSKIFQVSTIFCTFQSGKIASNFELRDRHGAVFTGGGETKIMDHVSNYFSGLTKKAAEDGHTGLPTPDNPFVLGYGISQDLKKIEEIDKSLSRAKTPRSFVPRHFGLAASKNPAALTYGLLTFRDDRSKERTIRADDMNAGKPEQNYFEMLKVPANLHDGLMVVSKGVFFDNFIKNSVLGSLWVQPSSAFKSLWQELGMEGTVNDQTEQTEYSFNTTYFRTSKWDTAWKTREPVMTRGRRTKGSGTMTVSASMFSDACGKDEKPRPGWTGTATDERRVFVDLWQAITLTIRDEYDPLIGTWELDRQVDLCFIFKYRIQFRSGKGGAWEMSLVKSGEQDCLYPVKDGLTDGNTLGGVPITSGVPKLKLDWTNPPTDLTDIWSKGVYINKQDTPEMLDSLKVALRMTSPVGFLVGSLIPDSEDQRSKDLFAAVTRYSTASIVDQVNGLNNVLEGLKTTIMLPAGEAFTFNGMDTDKEGNMFSHINYDTQTTGFATDKYGRKVLTTESTTNH